MMYRCLLLAASTVALTGAGMAQTTTPAPQVPATTAPATTDQAAPAAAPTQTAPATTNDQAMPAQDGARNDKDSKRKAKKGTQAAAPAAQGTATLGTVEPGLPEGMEPPAAPPTTTVAQALPALPDHATLNKLIAATDLGATLAGPGPFTVFAPVDEAFARMPAGALDTLLAPGNKPTLTRILQYHVVPGKLTAEQIKAQITAGGGATKLTTASGEQLTASLGPNGNIMLTDVNGVKSYVTQGDLDQTNGVVHVTNGVVFPKLG